MSNSTQNEMISGIITKTNGADKVIDLRDGLVLAQRKDYAMLFGAGGKNHSANSIIRVTLCDFTRGKGDKSVTVNANLELDVISLLRAVAENRMLTNPQFLSLQTAQVTTPEQPAGLQISIEAYQELTEALKMMLNASSSGQKTLSESDFIEVGKKLRIVHTEAKKSKKAMESASTAPASARTASGRTGKQLPKPFDFIHSQERVNIYRQGKDGLAADFAPVNKMTISRKGIRDDGQISRYPWTVKITNGSAKVKMSENGASTYDSSTLAVTAEAFINISDADMFRMMDACQRYVTTFMLGYGIPLVKEGIKEKERQRDEWISNRT